MSPTSNKTYYIPKPSYWPIIGSIALFIMFFGAGKWLHGESYGPYLFLIGTGLLGFMLYGWFRTVIHENRSGVLTNPQVDRSFRWGMIWFIFTEVMFFAAFFGALFYTRHFVVPWLGGEGSGAMTHRLLWPDFQGIWPVFRTPDPSRYVGPSAVLAPWGIPALNTAVLLTSAITLSIAHWAVVTTRRPIMMTAQLLTIVLGIAFIGLQTYEYGLAYTSLSLKLTSGIYGATFFMLTGFHCMHVIVGIIMLTTIFYRMIKKDFTKENHFGFVATAWYWHFVDVVWIALFVFVYWV